MLTALRDNFPLLASIHDFLVDNPFIFLILAVAIFKLSKRLSIAFALVSVAFALLGAAEDLRTTWLNGLDDPHMHIGRPEKASMTIGP